VLKAINFCKFTSDVTYIGYLHSEVEKHVYGKADLSFCAKLGCLTPIVSGLLSAFLLDDERANDGNAVIRSHSDS
jgi:hypothetical protein